MFERFRVMYCKISKRLTVKLNSGLLQAVNEPRI